VKLEQWELVFNPGWDNHFTKFDKETQKRILKKLEQMKQPLTARGLQSSRYQVEEVGQNRIAFIQKEAEKTKTIYFVGNHKQYEKWYEEQ